MAVRITGDFDEHLQSRSKAAATAMRLPDREPVWPSGSLNAATLFAHRD